MQKFPPHDSSEAHSKLCKDVSLTIFHETCSDLAVNLLALMIIFTIWMMNDEWWMMSDEWWVMSDEWWMMNDNDEWWMMNDEWWMMNDEILHSKIRRGREGGSEDFSVLQ